VQDAYQDNIDFIHRSWPYVNKLFFEYITTYNELHKLQSGTYTLPDLIQ